jgi:hypothetical protein
MTITTTEPGLFTDAEAKEDPRVKALLDSVPTDGEEVAGLKSQIRVKPQVKIEKVTPALAAEWLTANEKNRDLRPSRIMHLASMMLRGEFTLVTDCIGFDTEGYLINGQHRLSACVVSGISLEIGVMRGLARASQDVTDDTLRRKFSDALHMRGVNDPNNVASAINWLARLEYIYDTGNVHYSTGAVRPSTPQLLQRYAEVGPAVIDIVRRTHAVRREIPIRVGATVALWFHFLVAADVPATADLFFEKLASGANLNPDDPIYTLRRNLSNAYRNTDQRLPDYREAALMIKAWNAWVENRPTKYLAWKYGPTYQEEFPRITQMSKD